MKSSEIFAKGTTPDPLEMKGEYIVKLTPPLLPAFRIFGHKKIFPASVRETGGGKNQFFNLLKIGNFRIETGISTSPDKQPVLKIIYDHRDNPFFLKPLVDELKKIDKGVYLGRGMYRLFGKSRNIFYFTVTAVRRED